MVNLILKLPPFHLMPKQLKSIKEEEDKIMILSLYFIGITKMPLLSFLYQDLCVCLSFLI